ncbi:hypothetical protein KC723_02690 [Candidatus Kaiserbacteria bacterium]|nr:hypothetical protein [Candidatus Kaiserbacteria bacterium]
MGLFSKKPKVRNGVVVDIGSGSVLVSIVRSDPNQSAPEIIWSKREFLPLKTSENIDQTANHVTGVFMKTMLYVEGEGRKVLQSVYPNEKLTDLQVAISAPWSYTITKTISYTDKKEFIITDEMINELVETAEEKTTNELHESEITNSLGLTVMNKITTNILANGYPTIKPDNQKATKVALSHISAVAQEILITTINETRNKIIPKVPSQLFSFMLVYFYVVRELYPAYTDYCLVDITNEATEMGVVRDGSLQYCTHIPTGVATLAKAIANKAGIPVEEVMSYFRNQESFLIALDKNSKLNKVYNEIIKKYEEDVMGLFMETGDALSIPKTIFIHTDALTETFFNEHIVKAGHLATKINHNVVNISQKVLTKYYSEKQIETIKKKNIDTALLLSANFFHNHKFGGNFM